MCAMRRGGIGQRRSTRKLSSPTYVQPSEIGAIANHMLQTMCPLFRNYIATCMCIVHEEFEYDANTLLKLLLMIPVFDQYHTLE